MTTHSNTDVEEPTIDWLIDQIAPGNSPLLKYNKKRLKKLISTKIVAELENLMAKSPYKSYVPNEYIERKLRELKGDENG